MEEVGRCREAWFRQFLELPNGIPDEDTFRRVFERINPGELMRCLQTWLCEKSESGGRRIGIDGKTIRGGLKSEGCQTEIAKKIREKGGDYVLGVKENQRILYEEIQGYFEYLDSSEGSGQKMWVSW
jgi:hypothetical protein